MKRVAVMLPDYNHISLPPSGVPSAFPLPGNRQVGIWGIAIHPLSEVLDVELTGAGVTGFPEARLHECAPIYFDRPTDFDSTVMVRAIYGAGGRCVLQLAETPEERFLLQAAAVRKREVNTRLARCVVSETPGISPANEIRCVGISLPERCNQIDFVARNIYSSYFDPAAVTSAKSYWVLDRGPDQGVIDSTWRMGSSEAGLIIQGTDPSPAPPVGGSSDWTTGVFDVPHGARAWLCLFLVVSSPVPNATLREFGLLIRARQ